MLVRSARHAEVVSRRLQREGDEQTERARRPRGLRRHREGEMKTELKLALAIVVLLALAAAPTALAASDVNTVLSNLHVWLAGLLAALATLFLTIGGIRYRAGSRRPTQRAGDERARSGPRR